MHTRLIVARPNSLVDASIGDCVVAVRDVSDVNKVCFAWRRFRPSEIVRHKSVSPSEFDSILAAIKSYQRRGK